MASGIQLVAQNVKKLRMERAWPQEQLAEICDVSVRTVQRVESGETCSLETLKALATAFDLTPNDLTTNHNLAKQQEMDLTSDATAMPESSPPNPQANPMQGFKRHLAIYVAVNLMLFFINLTGNPEKMWYIYPLLGWGIGLISHWFKVRSHNSQY